MLELKNLCKKYDQKVILDHVSLSLQKGDIAVLLGHSGVGKSTLLRVINNLEEVSSGEIFLNHELLDGTRILESHQVGFVFQHFNLFDHLTVAQNIILPLMVSLKKSEEESTKTAHALLEEYHLKEYASRSPIQLSGGQKQRLAIARAVAMGPSVLCMDEPTSALDPMATNRVAEHIERLAKQGYIILIATHDTVLIEKFSCQIHLMEKGQILESAPSREFLSDRAKYPCIQAYIAGER